MVELKEMTAPQLLAVIDEYPWFAAARARLLRLSMQDCGPDAARDVLMDSLAFLPDVAFSAQALYRHDISEYRDETLQSENSDAQPQPHKISVAGMDYFSREQYESAKKASDDALSRIAAYDPNSEPCAFLPHSAEDEKFDIFTETLARIYADQGHFKEAIDIYNKLILQSPEKSAYFASLIDKLNS